MTGAFAKELGLPVRYQSAYLDETRGRDGDTYFSSATSTSVSASGPWISDSEPARRTR